MNSTHYKFEPRIDRTGHDALKTGILVIDHLNLDRIVAKVIHPNTELDWSLSEALQIADLYRIFLFLCYRYPTETIVPPREVDEFWHLHILDTRNYAVDCERIFGSYLHHYPYAGFSDLEADHIFEAAAIERTLSLVALHFPGVIE